MKQEQPPKGGYEVLRIQGDSGTSRYRLHVWVRLRRSLLVQTPWQGSESFFMEDLRTAVGLSRMLASFRISLIS